MITPEQKAVIDCHPRVKVVKRSISPLGYCTLESGYPEIVLNYNLNPEMEDIVLVHEYGHIDLGHMYVNTKPEYDRIRRILAKYDLQLGDYWYHTILNICMDIQINSTLLSILQLQLMKSSGFELMTSEYYKVPPGLHFREYYEPVIEMIHKDHGFLGELNNALKGFSGGAADENSEGIEGPSGSAVGSGPGIGDTHGVAEYDVESTEIDIYNMIQLIVNKSSRTKLQDSQRLANRNCRSKKLRYTSLKSVIRRNTGCYVFIIDVSGSMDTKLVASVCKSLYNVRDRIDANSRIILWDTQLVADYPIIDNPKIKFGGGTELSGSIKHASKYGIDGLVFITDTGTPSNKLSTEMSKYEFTFDLIVPNGTPKSVVREKSFYKYFNHVFYMK